MDMVRSVVSRYFPTIVAIFMVFNIISVYSPSTSVLILGFHISTFLFAIALQIWAFYDQPEQYPWLDR